MTFAPFARSHINLKTDRVSEEDGIRQERSAEEIRGLAAPAVPAGSWHGVRAGPACPTGVVSCPCQFA